LTMRRCPCSWFCYVGFSWQHFTRKTHISSRQGTWKI